MRHAVAATEWGIYWVARRSPMAQIWIYGVTSPLSTVHQNTLENTSPISDVSILVCVFGTEKRTCWVLEESEMLSEIKGLLEWHKVRASATYR